MTRKSQIHLDRSIKLASVIAATALLALPALAHEEDVDHAEPGWSATLVARHLQANTGLPSQSLAGFLLKGDAGVDPRNSALEQASLALTSLPVLGLTLHAELSRHGSESQHLEQAWASRDFEGSIGSWKLTVGRQTPELGAVWTSAGHQDRFALMPLAKQVATDGDWIEDGASLRWQSAAPFVGLQHSVDLGLWTGHGFPGSRYTGGLPSFHWGATLGNGLGLWQLDTFFAQAQVDARGARLNLAGKGHSHQAPVCDESLNNVVCYSGTTTVTGWSLMWSGKRASQTDSWWTPLQLRLGQMHRFDDGNLSSKNGEVGFASRNSGHLAEIAWNPTDYYLAWRTEHLLAKQRLTGSGASAIAVDAGFDHYSPIQRQTWAMGWILPVNAFKASLSLESGVEKQADISTRFTAIRLLMSVGGGW